MSLPYFIKLSQIVLELWPAKDFCFREDNYIKKKVRVVSRAHELPTVPPLHMKLSQTVWELWPAQDFSFRGDNYITKIV